MRGLRIWAIIACLCVASAVTQASGTEGFQGSWHGAIEIPGSPLAVEIDLAYTDETWIGTVDIPVQGAFDLPLVDFAVDGAQATFIIGGIPGEPRFDGALQDGAIVGTFTQSGQSFPFRLTKDGAEAAPGGEPFEIPVKGVESGSSRDRQGDMPADTPAEAEIEATYSDPAGRFTIAIPTNWEVHEQGSHVLLTSPDGGINLYFLVLEGDDSEEVIKQAWQTVGSDFDESPSNVMTPPAERGVEKHVITSYDLKDGRVYEGHARLHEGLHYVFLLDGDLAAFQRRVSHVQIAASGFDITALEEVDLSERTMRPLGEVLTNFETFVQESLDAFEIPGVVVGIVKDGEVAYTRGFGVRDHASGEPMTPDTHVMIGSVGKSLTTTLMAAQVDDATLPGWDTRVRELLPSFSVADPELSEEITVENLVCACTGVPRRDFEMLFNAESLDAEGIVDSVGTFEFFTDFGEAFQYSNQLVAVAGYAAAAADGAEWGELGAGYERSLAERVLGPIGMEHTTTSFEAVKARGEYAVPHQINFGSGEYTPMDLEAETILLPVKPAGAHWSTAADMTRYLATQLNRGVTPDGVRVVSEENLGRTWEPQVQITQNVNYGLGWMVGEYKGNDLIAHGGNTLGFTSDLSFLPEVGFGVVSITNGQGTNMFNSLLFDRLIELLYDEPKRTPEYLAFGLAQLEQQVVQIQESMGDAVDPEVVASHLGTFRNDALGEVVLYMIEGTLLFDTGAFVSSVRPSLDDDGKHDGYITFDPPLAGLVFDLEENDDGEPVIELGEGAMAYTLTLIE